MHKRFGLWLIGSLSLSIAGFFVGASAVIFPAISDGLLVVSALLSAAWLLVFVIAVLVHRWRGFWLLVGLPTAVAWPALLFGFASLAVAILLSFCLIPVLKGFAWVVDQLPR